MKSLRRVILPAQSLQDKALLMDLLDSGADIKTIAERLQINTTAVLLRVSLLTGSGEYPRASKCEDVKPWQQTIQTLKTIHNQQYRN